MGSDAGNMAASKRNMKTFSANAFWGLGKNLPVEISALDI